MKSSSQTLIIKYFFPVIMLFGGIFGIYFLNTQGDENMKGFANAFAVAVTWSYLFQIPMLIRLKVIEAKDNGVLVNGKNQQLIAFKDIVWISKFDLISPFFITIKYRDRVSGSDKKIAFMPKPQDQVMFQDDKLTAYLKNMIDENKSTFTREEAPSMVKNIFLLILLSLPVIMLMLYFMNQTFQII